MARAFLSHSSRDKKLVEEVANEIGFANVELDSKTFDDGALNVDAIESALKRSSIFVLFLTHEALASKAVRFEALIARELYSRGLIDKILVICLDDDAFTAAEDEWKSFNFVRRRMGAPAIARLIQNALIIAKSRSSSAAQPFVGRGVELNDAKNQLTDPLKHPHGIFVSGNAGIGRRTFAKRLYRDVFPHVNTVFPEIFIEKLDGYDEIYRKLIAVLRPNETLSAFRTRIHAFSIENDSGKAALTAQLLEGLIEAREAVVVQDHSGLLEDTGVIQPAVKAILDRLRKYPHPPIIFVAERTIPNVRRNSKDDLIYSSLPSLNAAEVRQLAGLLLKREGIHYTEENLKQIVALSDGHPFNVNFIVEAAKQFTLELFLADSSVFLQWKRRRAAEFIDSIDFSPEEIRILAALRDFSILDFDLLVRVADANIQVVGRYVSRLIDYHIVEPRGDVFALSPPLRVAVERDKRFSLANSVQKDIFQRISQELRIKNEETGISVSLIDAAILSDLQENSYVSEIFSAFLLPSHLVWLARRKYDEREFGECIRLTRNAIEGSTRLSPAGRVEACRLLCLASARLGETETFELGIQLLRRGPSDSFAQSNLNFLLGFNARLSGNLPQAEEYLRKSYDNSPGNFNAARELAAVCLGRGDIHSAEVFARQAYGLAPDNPYILDIMLSVLIKAKDKATKSDEEIAFLFKKLEIVGEEEGRSFYTTRRAEYEMKAGRLSEATKLIDDALRKTPAIFGVHALRAEIYLERGNNTIAFDEIKRMREIVYKRDGSERLSYLRPLLVIEAAYFSANQDYKSAKAIYERRDVFTRDEAAAAIKRIDIEEAYAKK